MNDPSETLRAFIEAKWELETEGVAEDDVKFTLVPYSTDRSPQTPHVIVQLAGFQRKQAAESSLYDFTFLVQVDVFPEYRKTNTDIATLRGLYWEMVNHLKLMFDIGLPTGWEYIYVESGGNGGLVNDTIPQEYIFTLTVKACIAWSD